MNYRPWAYVITQPARRELKRLHRPVQRRVIEALDRFVANPRRRYPQAGCRQRMAPARRRLAHPFHRDKGRALDRIVDAYADATNGAARKNRPRQSGSSTAIPSQLGLFGDIYV